MKLAEAILLRADLMKKIEQIENKIKPNLIVENSKSPQEDPVKMLAQLRDAIEKYKDIVIKTTKTNQLTYIDEVGTIMEAISKKDALTILLTKIKTIRQGSQVVSNYDNPKASLDINKLQLEIDDLELQLRVLNGKIQETNWTTELIED